MTDDTDLWGHVKFSRKAFSAEHGDPLWLEPREFSKWEAWADILQLASFGPYRYKTAGYGAIDLDRGEFVASLRYLGARWKWSVKKVRGFFSNLLKWERIRAQHETQAGIVYLIVKYDSYQSQGHSKGTAKGIGRAQDGHKREAVKAITTNNLAGGWTARLAAAWSERVGEVAPGYVGKRLQAAHEKHGVERVERAMLAYVAVKNANGQTLNFGWFAKEVEVWIGRTTQPIGVIDGEMSDTLELLTRPALVRAS